MVDENLGTVNQLDLGTGGLCLKDNIDVSVLVHVYDQVDLLRPFVAWCCHIGVTRILLYDMGSTDGSHEVLTELARNYPLTWSSFLDDDLRKYSQGNTGDHIAALAHDTYGPSWLMMCDADEFLCIEGRGLSDVLAEAQQNDMTALSIPCHNMTGVLPQSGAASVASLTTRIVEPYTETYEEQVSRQISRPFIFVRHPSKTIVWSSAFAGYSAGGHGVNVNFGIVGTPSNIRFHHYPMRSFPKFQQKVRNTARFLTVNDHLERWWAWHWRRWVEIEAADSLEEEFDNQFLSEEKQRLLVSQGVCVIDETVSSWSLSRADALLEPPALPPLGLDTSSGQRVRLVALDEENRRLKERGADQERLIDSQGSELAAIKARTKFALRMLRDMRDHDLNQG